MLEEEDDDDNDDEVLVERTAAEEAGALSWFLFGFLPTTLLVVKHMLQQAIRMIHFVLVAGVLLAVAYATRFVDDVVDAVPSVDVAST